MSVTGYIEEVNNINHEISRSLKDLKALRTRKKEIENMLKVYIGNKDIPGIKYKGNTIIAGKKNIREKRKKQEKESDAEEILSQLGINNSQYILQEIIETLRGPKTSTTVLKYKKA